MGGGGGRGPRVGHCIQIILPNLNENKLEVMMITS